MKGDGGVSIKVVVVDDSHGALGQRDKAVMMFSHEAVVMSLGFPHIERRVLALWVLPKKRAIAQKPLMTLGLLLPQIAVSEISRDIFLLDFKKDHVDKHFWLMGNWLLGDWLNC